MPPKRNEFSREKIYFSRKIEFTSEKDRLNYDNKVKSLKIATGKSIPEIVMEGIELFEKNMRERRLKK